MATNAGQIIELNLEEDGTVTVSENKDEDNEDGLILTGEAADHDVVMEPVTVIEEEIEHQATGMELETSVLEALPSSVAEITTEVENPEQGTSAQSEVPAEKQDPHDIANAEKIASIDSETVWFLWECAVSSLVHMLATPERCRRSKLLPADLVAVIAVWKSGDERNSSLTTGNKAATMLGHGLQQPVNRFVSISPPNSAAFHSASCESVNVFVLADIITRFQEKGVAFEEKQLVCCSYMWYFLHYSLVFYMRGGTVKLLLNDIKKDRLLTKTLELLSRLAKNDKETTSVLQEQHLKRLPHHFLDFIQGFFQMLNDPNKSFQNTHDELSVDDLLRILKMCKIPCPQVEGPPSRNDVMQVLFNASPSALQKVSTCFELTLQQMRQTNLRNFWSKADEKHRAMSDVLTRLADRLDLDYAQMITKQCKDLKSSFAADLICRLLRQSKHLTSDMFSDPQTPITDVKGSDTEDGEVGRALIIDMVTRQTKLIIPGTAMEVIPMETKDGKEGDDSETEVVVKGDVIGKIITLSQESGPDKDRLELMSHNCRKYDLLIIRDSGGIKKMSYTGSPGWEVANEFSPSEAMFVFLRELLMSPIKIIQTNPIVVDITMCYRLLKHLKSEDDLEAVFVECDQSTISEPVLTLLNGNENVTILIRCCSCVALSEFVEYLQRLAKQDSLDLSRATSLVRKNVFSSGKDVVYSDIDVASNIEILGARQNTGDLEAVEQSVISYLDENARLKNTPDGKQNFGGLSLLANCIEMNPATGQKVQIKGLTAGSATGEPEMEVLQRGKSGQTPTVIKVSNLAKSDLPATIDVDEILGEVTPGGRRKLPVVWIPVMVDQFSTDFENNAATVEGDQDKRKEIMIGIISEDEDTATQVIGTDNIINPDESLGENAVSWQLVDVDTAVGQQTPGAEVTIQSKPASTVTHKTISMEALGGLWSPLDSTTSSGNKRDRFPDWLIKQVDFGGIDGLAWVDKTQNVIRMPWKHASSSMWSMDDVELMRRWAVHTGKYAPQVTQCTLSTMPKNWKVNFRMSLNLYAQKMAKTRDSLICRIFSKPIKRVGRPIKLDI